jgi:hypothetical protein
MKQRWITSAFALAAVVYLGEAVLCGIVWSQFNKVDRSSDGAPIDLTPFPGDFTPLRVLWFAGIACGLLAVLLSALPLRPLLTFLAVAVIGFGVSGLWVTTARPEFAKTAGHVYGANGGFPEATILCAVAAGLAMLGVLLARPFRGQKLY